MVDARHVEPGRRRAPVGRSGEVEVLAAAIEDREARVREPVGRLLRDAGVERVDEDRVQVGGKLPRVGEVAAVGRPGRLERAIRRFVEIARHLREGAARDVDDPQRQPLVVERDLLAVGGPEGIIEERRRGAESDAAGFAGAVLRCQMQRVLAGGVGQPIRQPGEGLAVRGPGRIAVGSRRGVGQVADVALLGWHGEDVATGGEDGALAAGRDAGGGDLLRDVGPARPHAGQVALDLDVEPLHFALRDVVKPDLAEALDRDRARSGGGRLQVEPVVGECARHLAVGRVVAIERHRPVAVGEEVDRAARPHRPGVVRVGARDLLHRECREVDQPDRRRLAATVALPGALPLPVRHVGEALAIGRRRGHPDRRQRQSLRPPAGGGDGEEMGVVRAARARGEKEHLRAVGRPGEELIVPRMPGQTARLAAHRRDDVDVGVAVVLAGEGDRPAIGREERMRLDADPGRQPPRRAPLAPDDPQVVGVGEDHRRRGDGRRPQQERSGRAGCAGRVGCGASEEECEGEKSRCGSAHGRFAPGGQSGGGLPGTSDRQAESFAARPAEHIRSAGRAPGRCERDPRRESGRRRGQGSTADQAEVLPLAKPSMKMPVSEAAQ